MPLVQESCAPCRGETGKLGPNDIAALLPQVSSWKVVQEPAGGQLQPPRLQRRFAFKDFIGAMAFVNRMAEIAEAQGHHPDFTVHYNLVDVSLWTHDVGGLSRNDFILAAKIDGLGAGR
jgi:4a-hydroxytetrahydrobiopterin dehydratase